jgi:superfamily II DNA/RNA helicase
VTTDLAARGIDIASLPVVVNYEDKLRAAAAREQSGEPPGNS